MEKYEITNVYTTKNGTKVKETDVLGCYIIEPNKHGDYRGYFQETFSAKTLCEAGIELNIKQCNESFTQKKNTLRGLHFQTSPFTQAKLVRCSKGAIYDVGVDLRLGSPTYLQYVMVELSEENNRQLFLPRGFAHGFLTLTDNVKFVYAVDNDYNYESDAGVLWNDPTINVNWNVENPILSEKDMVQPTIQRCRADFRYIK